MSFIINTICFIFLLVWAMLIICAVGSILLVVIFGKERGAKMIEYVIDQCANLISLIVEWIRPLYFESRIPEWSEFNFFENRMWYMLKGLGHIVDGLVLVLSLGFLHSTVERFISMKCTHIANKRSDHSYTYE